MASIERAKPLGGMGTNMVVLHNESPRVDASNTNAYVIPRSGNYLIYGLAIYCSASDRIASMSFTCNGSNLDPTILSSAYDSTSTTDPRANANCQQVTIMKNFKVGDVIGYRMVNNYGTTFKVYKM